MRIQRCVSILLLSALIVSQEVRADTITGIEGKTYAIANGFTAGPHPEGSHFHSTNLVALPPGNPFVPLAGVAEVGGFFGDEEIRGVVEFPLQATSPRAILEFEILDLFASGISPEVNGIDGIFGQGPYIGTVDVFLYAGDDTESVSDFEIAPLHETPLLTIDVGPESQAGATIQMDVTDDYNALAAAFSSNPGTAASALGVRLQMAAPPDFDAGGITFSEFHLTLVPEPNAGALLLAGLVVLLCRRRSVVMSCITSAGR